MRLAECGGRLRGKVPDLRSWIELAPLESGRWCGAILASGGRRPGTESRRGKTIGRLHGYVGPSSYDHALRAQGLPADFLADRRRHPFTSKGRFKVVGNGVPLPMGRAIARAVRQALGLPLVSTVEVTNG